MAREENTVNPNRPPDRQTVDIFSAVLRPYRSLSRNGFVVLMIVFGGTCFAMGFFYVMIGAWPVFIFLGVDVLLLYVAFRINFWSSQAFEEIIVRQDIVILRRISARGSIQELAFNPYWTKLYITHDDEDVVTKITIATRQSRAVIGQFLNPDDKTTFAAAFGAALAQAKC